MCFIAVLGKVIKMPVKVRLLSFLTGYLLINKLQFDFVPEKSTIDPLVKFIRDTAKCIENELHSTILCFDLSKAFDSVCYNILLNKMLLNKVMFNIFLDCICKINIRKLR